MALRVLSLAAVLVAALATQAGAQMREIEVDVFYDRYGREIVLDRYTGEVLAVREPRRPRQGDWAPRDPLPRARDRHVLVEPDHRARLRREERARELGRIPRGGTPLYREYRVAPDDYLYEDEFYDDGYYEEDYAYPEQPIRRMPEPRHLLPGPVERAPLQDRAAIAPSPPVTDDTPAIEPPAAAIPDPAAPPQVGVTGASEEVARFQILLDRMGASPGVIDGRVGDNVNKAIAAYREITGETLRTYDRDWVEAALQRTGGDAFTTYEITAQDVAGPYVASIPEDFGEKARLERLGFTSVTEMLAERFHMDERYLVALNPGINFDRPGSIVKVANVGRPLSGTVTRIVADKGRKQVRAYGADGRLVAAYPATIGSDATPSPTGTHTVERIAFNPEYTYNPRVNFQQGNNTRVLTIPPGPNGPVGTVWIGLSKPTYGIHGTPEPSRIGRTNSNGCIRLTNWDAEELARMISPGVSVEFVD